MNYLEIALSIIAVLLSAGVADFYRRLFTLKAELGDLEDKMTAYEISRALDQKDIGRLTDEVRKANDTVLPTLQTLSTHVAVLSDRLKVHMNGGSK